jgi:FkbM family methyltransferase
MPAELVHGAIAEFKHRNQLVRMFVANAADAIQSQHFIGCFYEPEELSIIERHLVPGGVFLDVGANVGNHAIFVSKYCRQSEILVVEPNPESIRILIANMLLNGSNVMHFGVGLSDVPGVARVEVPENNLGAARMVSEAGGQISLVPGDSLFAHRKIDFIKMDVEGLELHALKGLERTIANSRPKMFVEVDNNNRDGFAAWCGEHNYRIEESFRRYTVNENFLIIPG